MIPPPPPGPAGPPPRRPRRALLLLAIPLLAALALLLPRAVVLPARWDPFAPLDLRDAPGVLTAYKLGRMERDPAACRAAFAASGIPVTRGPEMPPRDGCGIADPVRLPGPLAYAPSAPLVACPLAAAWTIYERHGLQPAAAALGTRVTGVRHLGAYNCRNVNHAARGNRSRHATGMALDVAAFTLADGRTIGLPRDWDAPDGRGAFLRAARDGACRVFGAVLGPEFNALHRDHFHFERGGWGTCR